MPSVQHQALELLVKNSLRPVCSSAGPFLTVYLPACHPGTSDLPRSPRLKAILRSAAAELERRLYRGSIDELLAPFEEIASDPAAMAGASDSVIFGAPAFFQHFRVSSRVSERLVVANHAHNESAAGPDPRSRILCHDNQQKTPAIGPLELWRMR